VTPASQISPELVLVCPELAARERAAMPDRPWEAFVPRAREQLAVPVLVAVAPERTKPPRWLRVVSLVPAALLVAFAALLLVGSISSFGERPSLAPASHHPDGSGAVSSGAASTAATWPTRPADAARQPANAGP
jgi:hypothetical protein